MLPVETPMHLYCIRGALKGVDKDYRLPRLAAEYMVNTTKVETEDVGYRKVCYNALRNPASNRKWL